MSEMTKRGSPTEDGDWDVLLNNGNAFVLTRKGDSYTYPNGGYSSVCNRDILAHRRHEPLVVPELRELPKPSTVPAVGSPYGSKEPFYGIKTSDNSFYFWPPWATYGVKLGVWKVWSKAECEAAGFKYPTECEP
jgi:hypothetical protein